MFRKLFFITLIAVGTSLSAQDSRVDVKDSDAMKLKATERTEVVNETVQLNDDQKTAVYDAYMWVERQNESMKQRYKNAIEDYQADIKHMYVAWDNHVDGVLQNVLTTAQMSRWVEALK